MMVYEHYLKKDQLGNDIFDHQAYEDNEQMQILSQISHPKRDCVVSHRLFPFFRRKKTSISNER